MRLLTLLRSRLKWTNKRMLGILILVWFIAYIGSIFYQSYKPLPEGLNVAAPLRNTEQVSFLTDHTYHDAAGNRQSQQQIFDKVLRMIAGAKRLIVLDMFLFNDYVGTANHQLYRPLTSQLTQALLLQKQTYPDMTIVFITDPVNTVYGGQQITNLNQLRAAGIEVIETNLPALRASNPVWSGFWALCCQWAGNNAQGGWLPNPLGQGKITLRSYLTLPNFRANHRKAIIVDGARGWEGLVTSGNPHDASSWHDNIALKFNGQAALDLLDSERAVARLSNSDLPYVVAGASHASSPYQLQVLTEARIRDAALASINSAQAGDQLDIAMFYFSHRSLIQALKDAYQRGVVIRLLLDPNEDAFGHKKNGIPNRQVALELQQTGLPVRWCNTHGEQCHSKMLLKLTKSGQGELILGSANYTRRNLDNLNLETDVRLLASRDTDAMRGARQFMDTMWLNLDGKTYSVDYAKYKDTSRLKYWWYRFGEWSGLSTF